ncbi:uncharacterized protein DS421_13g409990 [Arachis hypogaea]|nr:uncharacterized protein DS421_13g409990 [Arachis hypogaea]
MEQRKKRKKGEEDDTGKARSRRCRRCCKEERENKKLKGEGEERRRVKEKQNVMNAEEKDKVCSHTVLLCRRRCHRLGSKSSPSHPFPSPLGFVAAAIDRAAAGRS